MIATTLGDLEPTMTTSDVTGPALTFLGLAPREAVVAARDTLSFTPQEAL